MNYSLLIVLYMSIIQDRAICYTPIGHILIFPIDLFYNVGPRIWNALLNKFDVNVPISQFKQNNRKYLHDHSLVIVYPK